jgi:hypothetical protein
MTSNPRFLKGNKKQNGGSVRLVFTRQNEKGANINLFARLFSQQIHRDKINRKGAI